MSWKIRNACLIAHCRADDEGVLTVSLAEAALGRVCIGLCLLREDLISSVDMLGRSDAEAFKLQKAESTTSIQFAADRTVLSLNPVDLKRWLYFTLRTMRDGIAEVDHIDVEAIVEGKAHETATVVVVFPSSAPPVPAEEARRRIGL